MAARHYHLRLPRAVPLSGLSQTRPASRGVLRDTNRSDEARTILGEIYNSFTEGFELPDVKDAKALLDELSS